MSDSPMPAPPRGRSWLVGCAVAVAVPVVLVVLFVVGIVVYAGRQLSQAKAATAELCAAFPAGASAAGFEARATSLGLAVSGPHRDPGPPTNERYMASAGMFTDRWICTIDVRGGVVESNRVSFIN